MDSRKGSEVSLTSISSVSSSASSLARRVSQTITPPVYFVCGLVVSIGGFLNGYDIGSIGAITEMPYFHEQFGQFSPTMRGFVVSLAMLAGAFPSLMAGYLADRYGRVSMVLAGALLFAVGAALEAGGAHLAMLIVGRFLEGLAQGLYLGNVNVYVCEIAPRMRRGSMVAMPQFLVTAGTCAGYFTCYGTVKINSHLSWRLPFIIQAVLAGLMAVGCCFMPSSPRWLMLHGRVDEARRSSLKLDIPEEETEKDLIGFSGDENQDAAEQIRPGPITLKTIHTIFSKQYRSRTFLGLFILGMVQLCGIDGILFYAPTLFAQAGLSSSSASFLASGVTGILEFAISIPAFLFVDKPGRRTLIIGGGLLLSFSMYLMGFLYAADAVHPDSGAARWVVIVTIFVFVMTYVSTWGIVGKIVASEIQPNHLRGAANSLAQGLNFLTNWIVSFVTPIFLAKSSWGPYILYGSLSLFALIVLAICQPETKGRSLEEIERAFQSPQTGRFSTILAKFKLRKIAPSKNQEADVDA